MQPLISLIIPTHNEEKYIFQTLLHAVYQRVCGCYLKDGVYEIIVVDNNNQDSTVDIALLFDDVRVVTEKKPGLTWAREAGRKAAKGRYLVYIDADTHIPPDFLNKIYKCFISNYGVGGVGVPYGFYDGTRSLKFGCKCFFALWRLWDSILKLCGKPRFLFGPAFGVSAETMRNIGGFDTTILFYGEDANTTRRVGCVSPTRFLWDNRVTTSSRRYKSMGVLQLCKVYLLNYISMMLKGKPTNTQYTELKE